MSVNELDDIKKKLIEKIKISDPSEILAHFNIDFKVGSAGKRYYWQELSTSRDDDASVYLNSLDKWSFHLFTNEEANGSVLDLIIYKEKCSLTDAIDIACNVLNFTNTYKEALGNRYNSDYKPSEKNTYDDIERRKEENRKKRELLAPKIELVLKNELINKCSNTVKEFLNNRNINRFPPGLFEIKYSTEGKKEISKGEYKDYKYYTHGIGLFTGFFNSSDNSNSNVNLAGDVHLLKKYTNKDGGITKAQSFGPKQITVISSKVKSNKYAIVESKMDYAAAYSSGLLNLDNCNCIVLNGTGQYQNAISYLSKQQLLENNKFDYFFLTQNDHSCVTAYAKIIAKLNILNFHYVDYSKDEKDFDINDLTKKYGDKISTFNNRIKVGDLHSYINEFNHLFNNTDKKKSISTLQKQLKDVVVGDNFKLKKLKNLFFILQKNMEKTDLLKNNPIVEANSSYRNYLDLLETNYLKIGSGIFDEVLQLAGKSDLIKDKNELTSEILSFLRSNNFNKAISFSRNGLLKQHERLETIDDKLQKNQEILLDINDEIEKIEIEKHGSIVAAMNNKQTINETIEYLN